jgi:hypothetical protein
MGVSRLGRIGGRSQRPVLTLDVLEVLNHWIERLERG